MSSRTVFRWAAVALIVSAVVTVPGFAAHPVVAPAPMTTPSWVLSHLLLWIGALAGVAGLVGLYLRQREEMGTLGAVGGGLAAVGLTALSGAYYYEAVIVPALATDAPALMQTFPTGATWRTYLAAVAASGTLIAVGFLLSDSPCTGQLRFPAGRSSWQASAPPRPDCSSSSHARSPYWPSSPSGRG